MGAVSIGTFLGVVLEYFIDVGLIRDLQNENRTLRLKLAEEKQKQKQKQQQITTQRVEILDRRNVEAGKLFEKF